MGRCTRSSEGEVDQESLIAVALSPTLLHAVYVRRGKERRFRRLDLPLLQGDAVKTALAGAPRLFRIRNAALWNRMRALARILRRCTPTLLDQPADFTSTDPDSQC